MLDTQQIINLYTELAQHPQKDFGWDKGLTNAKAHGYKQKWIDALPAQVWKYCAAVGNPFSLGEITKGATVVDFGCGAGIDVLISSLLVGETGKVIGVDITPKMLQKTQEHAKLAGFENISVIESSFDATPIKDNSIDIVISNGAINLTSCKESVFAEIYRILKPNGKIQFADMIDSSIDEGACCSVEDSSCCNTQEEDWANCVAGTLRESELIEIMQNAGFKDVKCFGHNHYSTSATTKGATFSATKISTQELRVAHWDGVFKSSDYTQVLWHQSSPQKSLEFIKNYAKLNARIIDAGCGASFLIDNLLTHNYKNITLLDTSKISLDIVKKRVQDTNITYICADILDFTSNKKFDIWHDRAVFHFLLTQKERAKYFQVLHDNLSKNGTAIISTFRTHGPIACAGLDIVQYNHEKMSHELPSGFKLVKSEEYTHITPKGGEQEYIYFVIEKII